MNKINIVIAAIYICLGSYNVAANTSNYNINKLDTFIVNNYKNDAKLLYFNEIINDSAHADFNNPELNTNEIDKILEIFQMVYTDTPEGKDILKNNSIHGRYCYDFQSIHLKVKTGSPGIQNLSKGIIPTGNADLDRLLKKYGFNSVKTAGNYPNIPTLTLHTRNEYNMIPVTKAFAELPSVISADFEKGCIGDGATISLERNDSAATITFSIGSGDCPSGCTYHKYWEFRVENGKAKFIRSYTTGSIGTIELK